MILARLGSGIGERRGLEVTRDSGTLVRWLARLLFSSLAYRFFGNLDALATKFGKMELFVGLVMIALRQALSMAPLSPDFKDG